MLGVVLLLTAVALSSAIITMQLVIHGREVTVPDLRGQSVAEAAETAAHLHLDFSVAGRYYSNGIRAGGVMDQTPAPGTRVRTGWPLRVTESLGARNIIVPALTGMEERLAILQIHRTGLTAGSIAYLPWPQSVEGTVLAQMPKANGRDAESPVVQLLVAAAAPVDSGEQNARVMPRLTGEIFTEAALTVTHAGLTLAPLKEAAISIPPVG